MKVSGRLLFVCLGLILSFGIACKDSKKSKKGPAAQPTATYQPTSTSSNTTPAPIVNTGLVNATYAASQPCPTSFFQKLMDKGLCVDRLFFVDATNVDVMVGDAKQQFRANYEQKSGTIDSQPSASSNGSNQTNIMQSGNIIAVKMTHASFKDGFSFGMGTLELSMSQDGTQLSDRYGHILTRQN